jgi:PhoPQ-activated pathogenicity-related protein
MQRSFVTLSRFTLVLFTATILLTLAGCPPKPDLLPRVDFAATPISGFQPLTVQFSDRSEGGPAEIRAWTWSFGDGAFSTDRNPRHVYDAVGTYDVSLTVYTAYGDRTLLREGLIEVKGVSSFGTVGPAGGTIQPGGIGVTVAAGALKQDLVVGVSVEEDPFAPNAPEALAALSPAYTIFHNGEDGALYALGEDGLVTPAVLAFPFRADGVPAADLDPATVQVFCQLENGQVFPILGDIDGAVIRIPVTDLPARATYAVVYRPDAILLDVVADPGLLEGENEGEGEAGKEGTSFAWDNRWRLSFTQDLLAQMTALRLGSIERPITYSRRNFTEAEMQTTADEIGYVLNAVHLQFANSGLRSPVLADTAGGYGLVFYNYNPSANSSYTDFSSVDYRTRPFGAVILDPAQLLAIAQHNADGVRAGRVDEGQEISFGNAFAQTLFEACFEGYDYPALTTPSVLLGAPTADSRDVFFLEGIRDGLSVYFGQAADELTTARGLTDGEYLRLSQPLFFPFVQDIPGFSLAGQEFFQYVQRALDPQFPYAYITANFQPVAGILEGIRRAIEEDTTGRLNFQTGLLLAAKVTDAALEAYVGENLAEAYWTFAKDRAVENSEAGQLRPSDLDRTPGELIEDRFEEGAIVRAAMKAPTDTVAVLASEETALADIVPLSSRAIVLKVNPLATELTLTFDRGSWVEDDRGNSVGIAVYKQGEDAVELGAEEDTILLTGFSEDPDSCYATVVILISNLSMSGPNSVSVTAESFAELLVPESEVLDTYVNACDPAYTYSLNTSGTVPGTDLTYYVLEMTSGVWRGAQDVDQQEWRHFITIVEPATVRSDTAMLVISGGSTGSFSAGAIAPLAPFAQSTGSVVALLQAVPNQPLQFTGESFTRSEDAIIAYSYDKYLESFAEGRPDMTWPALLPMTRAAVRAMDTVQEFLSAKPRPVIVDDFAVTGASKRGWTTWLTGAADARVSAIMPLVIDVLNMEAQINHHYNAYGTFSSALDDYVASDIFCRFGTPESDSLLKIVDPNSYAARYTMPKLILNSTGDQFFLPDSSRFYYPQLPNEKNLYYAPNTDHGLGGERFNFDTGTLNALQSFYMSHVRNTNNVSGDDFVRPTYSWNFTSNSCFTTVRVRTNKTPEAVRLWFATNTGGRDFRVETIGENWESVLLEESPTDPGLYIGRVRIPGGQGCTTVPEDVVGGEVGWTGFFVQLVYPGPDPSLTEVTYGVSTEVRVVPDTYPAVPEQPISVCLGE